MFIFSGGKYKDFNKKWNYDKQTWAHETGCDAVDTSNSKKEENNFEALLSQQQRRSRETLESSCWVSWPVLSVPGIFSKFVHWMT